MSEREAIVVEADRDFRDALCDALKLLCELTPVVAPAGDRDALRFIHAQPSPPACVLVNAWLPGGDGMAVARELRSDPALAGVRVITISTSSSAEGGVGDHLQMPFDLDDLVAAVRGRGTSSGLHHA